ncbi:MAG: hypothetical protein N3F09_05030 [Bacteroidia bacterium]|nr:hypothetical protein [Bacteroidia bacterium]
MKLVFKIIYLSIIILVTIFLCEVIYRFLLFSVKIDYLRKPEMYSNYRHDDYWKLYYMFDGQYKPPKDPHPLLGWSYSFFNEKNYMHRDSLSGVDKIPVLMYGDSFTQCAHDSIICFQEFLNQDTSFNKTHYLFNYGIGGYGVDQMVLLFYKSWRNFKNKNPIIIINIMPCDMDRSILTFRTGQKPKFILRNDSLILTNVPINHDPNEFIKNNPPEIKSYLWRLYLNSKLSFKNQNVSTEAFKRIVWNLNKRILSDALDTIKKNNLKYLFIIFDMLWVEDGEWRQDSLHKFFVENNVNFINTRNLISIDTNFYRYDFHRYINQEDGHPRSYYNKILSDAIKEFVLLNRISFGNEPRRLPLNDKSDTLILYVIKKNKTFMEKCISNFGSNSDQLNKFFQQQITRIKQKNIHS